MVLPLPDRPSRARCCPGARARSAPRSPQPSPSSGPSRTRSSSSGPVAGAAAGKTAGTAGSRTAGGRSTSSSSRRPDSSVARRVSAVAGSGTTASNAAARQQRDRGDEDPVELPVGGTVQAGGQHPGDGEPGHQQGETLDQAGGHRVPAAEADQLGVQPLDPVERGPVGAVHDELGRAAEQLDQLGGELRADDGAGAGRCRPRRPRGPAPARRRRPSRRPARPPADGSRTAAAATDAAPLSSATSGGARPRRNRFWVASMSPTSRASRSPSRSRPARSGSRTASSRTAATLVRASTRKARSCETSRSAYRATGRAMPKARTPTMTTVRDSTGGCSAHREIR